jgi:hypothetical protein
VRTGDEYQAQRFHTNAGQNEAGSRAWLRKQDHGGQYDPPSCQQQQKTCQLHAARHISALTRFFVSR